MNWTLRPATLADLEPLADLRAVVMRPDLERLGRYDEHRVRQRLRDGFTPSHTRIIEVEGTLAGSIALRPASTPAEAKAEAEAAAPSAEGRRQVEATTEGPRQAEASAEGRRQAEASAGGPRQVGALAGGRRLGVTWWLEHFYLDPVRQGRGLGTAVLGSVLAAADVEHSIVRLNVLRGSAARRLYERHGFVVEREDPVDIFMIRKFPQAVEILR